MPLPVGTRLGPYEILSSIGAGGMGEVYRALDPRISREVAIKVLPASFSSNPDRLHRFEQEAKATGALNHPNILSIYDAGEANGSPYLVCELLEGETLREKLSVGAIPQRKAIEYALQISNGLAAAHNKGIIHRDLKPENLFITTDGRIKILDFGLVKLTQPEPPKQGQSKLETAPHSQPGTVLGTVGYMSPEQVRGKPSDHRSDIFSLGAILYEMISGVSPFRRETAADSMSAILNEDPPDLYSTKTGIAPNLDSLIRHCLEKNPEERFQSARDLAFDLRMISGLSSSNDAKTESLLQHRKMAFRNWFIAAGLIAATAIGFFAGRNLNTKPRASSASVSQPQFQRLSFQQGFVSSAQFAPDGHTVVYGAAFNENPEQLYSTRIESPESRNLNLPSARILSISKSGKMAILLNPHYTGGWNITGTLAQVPMDGGSPREILQDVGGADWTPDGKDLLAIRTRPDYRIEFPIGKVLYRTNGWISDARFSPSGEQIAFMEHPAMADNRGTIMIIDLKGKHRKISEELPSTSALHWNPAATEIWLVLGPTRNRTLVAIDLSGKQRVIYQSIEEIQLEDISPDGVALLASWNRRRQMYAALAGQERESNLSWFDYSISVDISNDGKTILFQEPGDISAFQYPTFIRNIDGSPPIYMGEGDAMSLSPDGKWALAGLWGNPYKLVLLPTGMGEKKVISIPGLQPPGLYLNSWFRDSKRLIVRGSQPGRPLRHWIYNLEFAQLQPATPEGVSVYAIPTADQNSVLACCKDHRAWLFDLQSGGAEEAQGLTEDDLPVQWTPDGKSVYVMEEGSKLKISLVNVGSGQRTPWKEIAPSDSAGVLSVDNFHVTPDGKTYVYSVRRVLSDLFLVKGLK